MCRAASQTGLLIFLVALLGWLSTGRAFQTTLNDDNAVTVDERREALRQLSEATTQLINSGQVIEAARAFNRMGRLQLKLNTPQSAVESFSRSLSLLEAKPAPAVEVDSLNGLAAAYLVLKHMDQGPEILRRSLELSQRSGYARGQAEALLTLSEFQNFENHLVALHTARESLELWQTLGDKSGLARAYSQIGRCSMAESLLPEATQNYETALGIWRDLNDRPHQAEALTMLGFIEQRKAEWQSSIGYLTQAQTLVDERAEPRTMGQISAGLAAAFNENGLPEYGLVQYQRALSYFQLTQDPRSVRSASRGLAWTYFLMQDYGEATARFQAFLSALDPDSLDATDAYHYLGRICIETKDYPAALRYLRKALAILTRAHNPKEAAQMRGLIAQVYKEQGDLPSARRDFQSAIATFRDLADTLDEAAIYYALGRLELDAGNLGDAETKLAHSIELTENIRRVPTSSDLTAAFSATVQERYESYIACLMRRERAQPERGFATRAFEASELGRARSLSELLRATQTDSSLHVDPELARQERAMRQTLRAKEDYKITVLSREYKKEELDALNAELAQLETRYKQILDTIKTRYPLYERITRPTAWDLKHIQEKVVTDEDTVLLEYSLGVDRSYVWAVTRDKVTSHELPPQATIMQAVERIYSLMSVAPSANSELGFTAAAHELSDLILAPVAPLLNKKRIVILADGALNYVPFQSLPISSRSDDPLISIAEVTNAPSASILGELREEATRRQAPAKVLAAFGDPVFASNLAPSKQAEAQSADNERWRHALRDIDVNESSLDPSRIQPLFYARRELKNLSDVAGSETLMLTGFDASRQKLLQADLSKYSILHFATHGVLDPKRPENSGLFLSMVDKDGKPQNGFLTLQDIYGLNAPVDLVVLSACRTALGKNVRGEGLIGLTRGFMYAGASSVVASLWKVDDEATAELMKRFYKNMLEGGLTPAAALREAQNSIRKDPKWRAPYYWAAFTLQGEYLNPIKPVRVSASSYRKEFVLAVIVVLLLATGLYLMRRRALTQS
jgi:CHAT domain-containing protein